MSSPGTANPPPTSLESSPPTPLGSPPLHHLSFDRLSVNTRTLSSGPSDPLSLSLNSSPSDSLSEVPYRPETSPPPRSFLSLPFDIHYLICLHLQRSSFLRTLSSLISTCHQLRHPSLTLLFFTSARPILLWESLHNRNLHLFRQLLAHKHSPNFSQTHNSYSVRGRGSRITVSILQSSLNIYRLERSPIPLSYTEALLSAGVQFDDSWLTNEFDQWVQQQDFPCIKLFGRYLDEKRATKMLRHLLRQVREQQMSDLPRYYSAARMLLEGRKADVNSIRREIGEGKDRGCAPLMRAIKAVDAGFAEPLLQDRGW